MACMIVANRFSLFTEYIDNLRLTSLYNYHLIIFALSVISESYFTVGVTGTKFSLMNLFTLCASILLTYISSLNTSFFPRDTFILIVEDSSCDIEGTISILNCGPLAIMPFSPSAYRISSLPFLSLLGLINSKLNLLTVSSTISFNL